MEAITGIYGALSARAYANQRYPESGFNDRSAQLLAKVLGITDSVHKDSEWERNCLLRSQWFDARCRQFFRQYPQGMCIDLGAGLSTRFHRLSEADDWPRFSWVDIDLPEITAIKKKAIPTIDSYQLIAADIVQEDWLAKTGWHPRTPLIVTLESVLMEMPSVHVRAALSVLTKHSLAQSHIEIVFDYPVKTRSWKTLFQSKSWLMSPEKLTCYLLDMGIEVMRYEQLFNAQGKGAGFFTCRLA